MNRLTRITATLIHLQSKRIVTAKELALRFEVSLRTVYRDIKTLQDAGVPIGSENGVGYFIVEGYKLPPISLTQEEANALIVSDAFINSQGDKSLIQNFNSLIIKIKATLKNFQKDYIELLSSRVQKFNKDKVVESHWLSVIQKSIIHKKRIQITYLSIYKNELTHRNIEPLAIYFTNNLWIVVAFCHLRVSLREFRLDRISSLLYTDESFTKSDGFNLQDYFKNFES